MHWWLVHDRGNKRGRLRGDPKDFCHFAFLDTTAQYGSKGNQLQFKLCKFKPGQHKKPKQEAYNTRSLNFTGGTRLLHRVDQASFWMVTSTVSKEESLLMGEEAQNLRSRGIMASIYKQVVSCSKERWVIPISELFVQNFISRWVRNLLQVHSIFEHWSSLGTCGSSHLEGWGHLTHWWHQIREQGPGMGRISFFHDTHDGCLNNYYY